MKQIRIGLIGDRDDRVTAHWAIARSLEQAGETLACDVQPAWLPTAELARDLAPAASCDGLWCVPASPYADGAAAIAAIRLARERPIPFLGTCGGYQHALLEYARNVLGLAEAAHGEETPDAALVLIGRLSCDLVEVTGPIRLKLGSRLASLCGRLQLGEGDHCRFGLDPRHRARFEGGPLRIVGEDPAGEARAFELSDHSFFLGTAFQPERAILAGRVHPIVLGFLRAAREARARPPAAGAAVRQS